MTTSRLKLTLLVALLCGGVHSAFGQAAPKEQEAQLIAVLKSAADYTAKADACRELARIGTAEAVPALAALLADEKLSHMARYGLEPNPSPAVDEALRQALGTLKGRQLVGVIGSVGVRRDGKAAVILTGMLKDPDAEVAQTAARALGRIATPDAAKAMLATLDGAPAANKMALYEGLLRSAEAFVANGGKDQAGVIYDSLRKLPDAPHQVRTAALRGVVVARPKEGSGLVLEALRGSDPGMAAAGVQIAMELTDPALSKVLADELGKVPADRQILLLNVLGKRGDTAALPALIALSKAGEPKARVAAIVAVTEIGSAGAAVPLMALLMDPDAQVAQAAAAGLAGLSGGEVDDLVILKLADSDPALKLKLVDIVRQRRIAKALPVLLKMMDDSNPAMKAAAIVGYGELAGEAELAGLLARMLKSSDAGEIAAIEKALVAICSAAGQPGACVPGLVDALGKAGPLAKVALLRTLSAVGGADALKAVREAVNDPANDIHTAALRLLSGWKTADAVPVLLELAKSSNKEVDKILSLRGCLGMAARKDVPAPQKLAICREAAPLIQRDDERRSLLGVLGSLANAGSLDLVVPCLDQPGVKQEAVAAVMAIAEKRPKKQHVAATKAALQKVSQVAADNPAVVKRAQELLKGIESEG